MPFATSLGGTFFSPFFLAVIALWNAISVKLIIECKYVTKAKYTSLLSQDQIKRENSFVPSSLLREEEDIVSQVEKLKKLSTYSLISYDSLGSFGLILTDFCIIVTLLGVCIAYQITFATLFADIWPSWSSSSFLSLSLFLLLPLCYIKNLNFLSIFSFLSLIFLVLSIIIILYFGFHLYSEDYFSSSSSPATSISFFPSNLFNTAKFIGIGTFCYGLSSMAFPIESSMRERKNFMLSVVLSLVFVWSLYILIGNVGAVLYIFDEEHGGIKENILNNLPSNTYISNTVRFCMGFVSFKFLFSISFFFIYYFVLGLFLYLSSDVLLSC